MTDGMEFWGQESCMWMFFRRDGIRMMAFQAKIEFIAPNYSIAENAVHSQDALNLNKKTVRYSNF